MSPDMAEVVEMAEVAKMSQEMSRGFCGSADVHSVAERSEPAGELVQLVGRWCCMMDNNPTGLGPSCGRTVQ